MVRLFFNKILAKQSSRQSFFGRKRFCEALALYPGSKDYKINHNGIGITKTSQYITHSVLVQSPFFDKFIPKNNNIGPIWILVTSVDLCEILEVPRFKIKGEGTIYLFCGSSCGKPGHEPLVGMFCYCFRLVTTDNTKNRIIILRNYELELFHHVFIKYLVTWAELLERKGNNSLRRNLDRPKLTKRLILKLRSDQILISS